MDVRESRRPATAPGTFRPVRGKPPTPFLVLTAGALALAGCGSGGGATHVKTTTTATTAKKAPPVVQRIRRAKAKPKPVQLQLELPGIGLSSAPKVTYAAPSRRALLRGAISPPGTTLLLEDADGNK